MTKFKPMLSVDATDHLEGLKYPKIASTKLDGIRAVFCPNLGLVSRSLKPIQNKQLCEKFTNLLGLAKELDILFDGEFYNHDLTFQEITALVMTQDFLDPKNIKKLTKDESPLLKYYNEEKTSFINPLEYHAFDMFNYNNPDSVFVDKVKYLRNHLLGMKNVVVLEQCDVNSPEEIKGLFLEKLDQGYEGLILRDPNSPYKFGRSTLNEEYSLKVKPMETFDAKITGVVQSTVVDPNAEKTINELGRSVTSKKKDDRILIEKASGFLVDWEGVEQKVSLAMTDPEKEEVWKNKESYIGRMIEFKGMVVGSKDAIRHPVFVRFRDDKE